MSAELRPSAEDRWDVAIWDGKGSMERYVFLDAVARNRIVDFAERHGLKWNVRESRSR